MAEHNKSMPIISLLWAIRDARSTRNAERQLLDALAMRCNPAKGFACWPSYELLASDTGCNVATLKKAAARLEQKRLIHRQVRRNKSNIFSLNIKLIFEEATIQREADKARKDALCPESGFPAFTPPDTDLDLESESDGSVFADREDL